MNERIDKLVEQAIIQNEPDWIDFRKALTESGSLYLNVFAEKFAELIVRECLTLCEHESNDDPHDEYDMGMFVKSGAISDRIKHHFGVEE